MTEDRIGARDGEVGVPIARPGDVILAGATARQLAAEAGFRARGQAEVAIIAQELASNIQKYAPGGTLALRRLTGRQPGIELRACDRGPGIADVEAALRDGHSEPPAAPSPHEAPRSRSLGLGLGAVRRLADELVIDTRPGCGTLIVARKFVPGRG